PSRTTVEWAVRWIVVAISSAIDASAFATSCCVIGSIRVLATLEHKRVGFGVARDDPPCRDDDRRVVLVHEERAGLGLRADRGARAHRDAGARARARRAAGVDPREADIALRPERSEPHGADLDRRPRQAAHAVE